MVFDAGMIKIGAYIAVVVVIGGLYMDARALRAEKGTLATQNATLTGERNTAIAETGIYRTNYNSLQLKTEAALADIQASMKQHSDDILAIEEKQNATNVTLRSLKDKSDASTKAVLDYRLPQYVCLFNGTCSSENKTR